MSLFAAVCLSITLAIAAVCIIIKTISKLQDQQRRYNRQILGHSQKDSNHNQP